MFEISWSELLVLAVVTLIFVGPKDLPVLFNTLGRYAGALRRQANEFKQHFEDAMREAEMDSLRKELDSVRDEVLGSVREAEQAADASTRAAQNSLRPAASPAGAQAVSKPDDGSVASLPAPDGAAAPAVDGGASAPKSGA